LPHILHTFFPSEEESGEEGRELLWSSSSRLDRPCRKVGFVFFHNKKPMSIERRMIDLVKAAIFVIPLSLFQKMTLKILFLF
jgi:hypothetical protein